MQRRALLASASLGAPLRRKLLNLGLNLDASPVVRMAAAMVPGAAVLLAAGLRRAACIEVAAVRPLELAPRQQRPREGDRAQQLVVASQAVLHEQVGKQNCQPVGSAPEREQQR